MPLFDRVKTQAKQVAQKAQEAGQAGQAKIDELQAKRQADATLRRLGLLVYASHVGRGGAEDESAIQQAVTDLTAYESEHGPLTD